ncbi:MAG: hypothetical protein U5L45_09390 [Saprospiraceae bacterium]|nr:hypothetical protein [Saprospiraceae bacterium]
MVHFSAQPKNEPPLLPARTSRARKKTPSIFLLKEPYSHQRIRLFE